MYEIIKTLDAARGVSGHEACVAQCVKELFAPYCDCICVDNLGSVHGTRSCNIKGAPTLMIEAHMDEIGMIVSGFTAEGSLLFLTMGGIDPKVLPGTTVTVHSHGGDIFGVIGAKPPHLVTDRSKAVAMEDMAIDIGFCEEKTRSMVEIGDIITINTSYERLAGTCVAARCLDDRAGIAIILRALEIMADYNLKCNIHAVAAVQEEVGLRGAKTAAQAVMPDAAIAIDVCHGTSPGVSDDAFECGKGIVVSVGPNLHPLLTKQLFDAAKEDNLDIQIDVENGNTGTDAWEIQVAGTGVPVALLSIPLRYMHSNYEVCDVRDLESAARLIAQSALKFKGGDDLCF